MSKKLNKVKQRKFAFLLFVVLILIFFALFIFLKPFISQTNTLQKPTLQTKTNNLKPKIVPENTVTPSPKKENTYYQPAASGNSLKVPILFYHYVGNNPNSKDLQRDTLSISPDKFDAQMKYLRDNGYSSISFDTLYAALRNQASLPNKPVVLTFDDGYIDFYYNAYGILRTYGMSATVFVITGLVGQPAYLTWPQIQEMQGSGLIHFGAHTVHHYNLPSVSPDTAFNEIQESKKVLQDHLGVPINFMAYPNGATNSQIVSLVQKAGYVGAAGTWPNTIQSESYAYNIPRIRISGSISIENFASLLK
jgi:peptidoglycan/xylan/chitin deacetylase (PgdA/CDA1 family)